jgi:acyl-CoA thioester hydrolase
MEPVTPPLVSPAARPHPARTSVDTYPVRGYIDARYGDMDANGHLNNLALEALHENTRATFNARLFPGVYDRPSRQVRIVTASNVVHFLREAFWPSKIQTAIGVGRIGRTSFVSCTALFIDGECIGLCDTALVLLGEGGPTPIPEDVREQLAAHQLRVDNP